MFNDNILMLTDSYKPTHWKQLPKGVTILRSYLESRGGKFDNTLFYGLQYIIKESSKSVSKSINKLLKLNFISIYFSSSSY